MRIWKVSVYRWKLQWHLSSSLSWFPAKTISKKSKNYWIKYSITQNRLPRSSDADCTAKSLTLLMPREGFSCPKTRYLFIVYVPARSCPDWEWQQLFTIRRWVVKRLLKLTISAVILTFGALPDAAGLLTHQQRNQRRHERGTLALNL